MILQKLLDNITDYLTNTWFISGQVGTGTTDPTVNDTGLETEIAGTGKALDSVTVDGNTVQAIYTLGAGEANSNDITEFIIYNSDDTKVRETFSPVSKTSSITLDIIYGLTLSQENL